MKINLRKSAAVQNELRKMLNEKIERTTEEAQATYKEFDIGNVVGIYNKKAEEWAKTASGFGELKQVYFSIRQKTSEKNASCGVNDTLTNMAELVMQERMLLAQLSVKEGLEPQEIEYRLTRARNLADKTTTGYGDENVVTSSVFTKEMLKDIERILKIVKRDKQVLSDCLLDLNVKTEIELSEAEEKFLVDQGLI